MGEAMIRGVVAAGVVPRSGIVVYDVNAHIREALASQHGVRSTNADCCAPEDAERVVLAVKPQSMPTVLDRLRGVLAPGQVALSVAAGVTLERLTTGLEHATVVRAMPNTPAQVGAG